MSAPSSLNHLAIIMDGNGRWAKKHNHQRIFGHIQGAKTARWLITHCAEQGLHCLSLFALSSENMNRPPAEITGLKTLLEKVFLKHSNLLSEKQIQLNILGDISVFSSPLQKLCESLCEKTKQNKGLKLIVALNYGGQQEIIDGVKLLAKNLQQNKIQVSDINKKSLTQFFSSSAFPPPDLIIRTGGQVRLSNFYLWSSAYSELYFTDTLWPDFNKQDLNQALQNFSKTQRRFGKI